MLRCLLLLLFLVPVYGCHPVTDPSPAVRNLSRSEINATAEIARRFWSSAAVGDSTAMTLLSSTVEPSSWAREKELAFPGFFQHTNGRLRVFGGYFLDTAADTAAIEFEVPWQTCRQPIHDGRNDRYHARLVKGGPSWRLAAIWFDPC